MNSVKANKEDAGAQLFAALQAYESLKIAIVKQTARSRLSFSDIAYCAMNPGSEKAQRIRTSVNENVDYFRKYRFVLSQVCRLQSHQKVAASTQERLLERREDEFTLQIDLMPDDNAFVCLALIDLGEYAGHRTAFLHCELKGKMELIQLSRDEQGNYIVVLSASDEALHVLTNVNTHLYLSF